MPFFAAFNSQLITSFPLLTVVFTTSFYLKTDAIRAIPFNIHTPIDEVFLARPLLLQNIFLKGNAFQKFTFILRSPQNVLMLFFPFRKVVLSERGRGGGGTTNRDGHKQFAAPPPPLPKLCWH